MAPSKASRSTTRHLDLRQSEAKSLRHVAPLNKAGCNDPLQFPARWDQIDFTHAVLHVRRLKKGTPATHPVVGDELRALRKLQREQDPKSSFVFTSERGSPFTTAGFARMVERVAVEAKLGFKAHPHMLRHACGFALANKGHDTRALQAYLGV
jgi:integrase